MRCFIGDALSATAEKGEAMITAAVRWVADELRVMIDAQNK